MQVNIGSDLRGMQRKDATRNDFYADEIHESSDAPISDGALRALVVGGDGAANVARVQQQQQQKRTQQQQQQPRRKADGGGRAALRSATIAKLRSGAYFNGVGLRKHRQLNSTMHKRTMVRRSETIKNDAYLFTRWLGAIRPRVDNDDVIFDDARGNSDGALGGGRSSRVAPATAAAAGGEGGSGGGGSGRSRAEARGGLSVKNKLRAGCHKCLGATDRCMTKARKAGLVPVLTVLCWIIIGTLVYHFVTGFYWSQAFFYAIDAGFSVGYGAFEEGSYGTQVLTIPHNVCAEAGFCANGSDYVGTLRDACMQMSVDSNEWSMVYTILHVIFGASLVATALTVMLIHTLDRTTYSPEDVVEREIELKKQQRITHDLAVEEVAHLTDAELRTKLLSVGGGGNTRTRRAMEREWAQYRRKAVTQQIRDNPERRIKRALCNCVVTRHTCKHLVATQLFKTSILLFCWIVGGVCFGVYEEGWPILDSVYFAITSLSTAGLKSPTHHFHGAETNCTNASWGECQTFPMVFVGVFCFVGVPLFAMVLGSIASFQIDQLMELRVQKRIERNIEVSEFEFADSLAGGKADDFLEYVEFLQISLLRSGLIDQEQLDAIRAQFDVLDINADQKVSRLEVAAMAIFNKFDVNSSGHIDFLEYLLCVDSLNEFFPELVDSYDDLMLEDVFMKVSLIDVQADGTCAVPVRDFHLPPYSKVELAKARISRLQFMVWCKDKISAVSIKLKLHDVTGSDGGGSDGNDQQGIAREGISARGPVAGGAGSSEVGNSRPSGAAATPGRIESKLQPVVEAAS